MMSLVMYRRERLNSELFLFLSLTPAEHECQDFHVNKMAALLTVLRVNTYFSPLQEFHPSKWPIYGPLMLAKLAVSFAGVKDTRCTSVVSFRVFKSQPWKFMNDTFHDVLPAFVCTKECQQVMKVFLSQTGQLGLPKKERTNLGPLK